jgi:hypothetical protein
MKSSKQRVSLLKNKISEELPDGVDIFGFEGISKQVIIDSLDESYNLLSLLEEYKGGFETIFLERKIAEYFEKISKLFKKEDFEINKEKFNDFLYTVQKIHFQIKETYILVAKEPIRTEIELDRAKKSLVELQLNLENLKPIFTELNQIKENSEVIISELSAKQSNTIENEQKISTFLRDINAISTKAQKSSTQVATWEENIKNIKEELSSKSVEFTGLNKKIEILKLENEQNERKINELTLQLESQLKTNSEFQAEIQKTIQDANRHGMAGSFKARKDELSRPLLIWQILTLVSIVVLIFVSYLVLRDVISGQFEWNEFVARMPIFASCVWLGWFCAKQYGYTSRIREDYAYKYAVSMAFEGYKNATKELDQDLLFKLLDTTIFNVAKNPLNIYETNSNHGTPYHEFFDKLKSKSKIEKDIPNDIEVNNNI